MKIKEIRKLTGLSQAEFGKAYDIPVSTIKKWEVSKSSKNHRECPVYVNRLLERAVRMDYHLSTPDANPKNIKKGLAKIKNTSKNGLIMHSSMDYSVREISKRLSDTDSLLLFGNFLDTFYYESTVGKEKLICEAPVFSNKHKIFMCQLAASVETLAERYNIEVPEWVNRPEFFLSKPHFALNTQNAEYRAFLRKTSLTAYKKRNLYLGSNVLQRV